MLKIRLISPMSTMILMSQTLEDKRGDVCHLYFHMDLTVCSVAMPDGGNPLTQEEQSEYLLWKNVFSAVRHGRRNEVF